MPILASAFARRTLGFLVASIVALLVIVLATVWLAAQGGGHAEEVLRARDIRTLAANLLTSLLDAETSQRGFLITEETIYLEPYEAARPRLVDNLDRLRQLTAGYPEAAGSVARLTELVDAKLAELDETIQLARSGNAAAAREIVRSDRGKAVMDETREVMGRVIDWAEGRVLDRLAQLSAGTRNLTWATLVGAALILAFAAAATLTVFRYTRDLVVARGEVEALNHGLEERVAERTAALTRANDEIQRFAYIVSHDLRAPLVNIMGFTSELEVGAKTLRDYVDADAPDPAMAEAARLAVTEDLPEAVRFIRTSTTKMDRLINAILKLSREGRRELKAERVDLGRLLQAAAASVQHQLDNAGARIELAPRFPVIVSDRLALEQVFGNLIENAVKYLAAGRPGVIEIGTAQTASRVQVTVKDNGRGVDPKDHERIFELFRRSGAQDTPGEGIGLAHVRALVRRLGGDVTVQSHAGEGSAFTVDLPKRPSASGSAAAP